MENKIRKMKMVFELNKSLTLLFLDSIERLWLMAVFLNSSIIDSPCRVQTPLVLLAADVSAETGNDGAGGTARTAWKWGGGGAAAAAAAAAAAGNRDIFKKTATR